MTPIPDPTSSGEFINAGITLIENFGLMAVVMATAVIGLAMYLLKKARSGAK